MTAKRGGGDEVVELTRQLIATESHRDTPGRERDIGQLLAEWFGRRGLEARLQAVDGDRANVVVRIPGGEGPSLMLNGHLDTVPAGDMSDPFAPRIEDGVLWGRGACDMKGAVAAMCCAVASLVEDGSADRLSGDLLFAGTVDEETGSLGVRRLVDGGIVSDRAVVGEPTGLRLAVAHKGSCFVTIELAGRGAHGSCPERGVNAATHAARVAVAIEERLRPRLAERIHPLLGASTVSIGRICGGTQPNIVAERCEIHVDRRYLPGEVDPVPELRELVGGLCDGIEGLGYEVVELPMTATVPHAPLGTDPAAATAEAARAACRGLGLPTEPIGVTYWTDGGHLAASGVETVVLGPGDIGDAHGPHDRVAVGDLTVAVELYRRIAMALLGPSE